MTILAVKSSYRKMAHHQIAPSLAELTKPGGRTTMPPAMPDPSSRRFVLSGLPLCFFFSGAAGLIYQVAWSKALGLIFGHTAYAVATGRSEEHTSELQSPCNLV